jgi:hypothetical protein
MHVPSQPSLIRRMIQSRLKKVAPDKPVLTAGLSLVYKRCGKPSCSCREGGPGHKAHHLTFKQEGKTRTIYVPVDLLDEVQSWVAEHQRLKQLLAEINQLSLALVQGHVRDRKRRRGRP